MKKILYFLKIEARLLKKSIIIIALILTLFMGVFMGVLSVRIDMVNGMYSVLDEFSTEYRIATKSDGDGGAIRKLMGYTLIFGYTSGLTDKATMSAEGTSVTFPYRREVDGMLQLYPLEGTLVVFNDSAVSEFALHEDAVLAGDWPDGNDQIFIEKIIAEILEVEVGDRVTIREHDYTLCGIYDKSALPEKGEFFNSHYYITDSREINYEYTYALFSGARSAHACFKRLGANGFAASVKHGNVDTLFFPSNVDVYFEIIHPAQAVLDAISLLILAVIIVALYTLMTVFFRQRKSVICQLKLLGGNNGTILGIYIGLAVTIIFVATLLASLLGVLFNNFFLNFFESIFQLAFRATFNIFVPVISFFILAALTALLFALSGRRIRSDIIAQEIKAE